MKNANPLFQAGSERRLSRAHLTVALVMLAFGLAGCAKERAAEMLTKAATSSPKSINERFPIKVGDKVVRMQLAVRPGEMQRGLMERRDLERDEGMLFVYDRGQQMSFWMKNTPTALDIGFFNRGGVLQEIYQLHPFDEKTVSSQSHELQFALEMNQGWFAANGVKPGAQLDLKALAAALKDRAFEPRRFGLGN